MSLENAIRSQLLGYPALTALIAQRVYPVTYPQDVPLPVVVYQRTGRTPEYLHDGEARVAESRFQISSFAETYSQVKQVAASVKAALLPWITHQTNVDGVTIGAVFIENEIDLPGTEEVEQLSAFHVLADYLFLHTESD